MSGFAVGSKIKKILFDGDLSAEARVSVVPGSELNDGNPHAEPFYLWVTFGRMIAEVKDYFE